MSLERCFLVAVGLLLVGAAPAAAESEKFGVNSPADPFHRWVVPATVCSATFDLYGAEGSAGAGGAQVTSTMKVTPGSPYDLYVGDQGTVGKGGYNGGGAATANAVGGGGATDVRTGPGLSSRILVAGGGGGNGGSLPANGKGGLGGLLGKDGTQGPNGYYSGGGGKGGTASAGGAGGFGGPPVGPETSYYGKPGALGVGGAGGVVPPSSGGGTGDPAARGGGGGGGYYGGGGGGSGTDSTNAGGGGGGGSSLTAGGTVGDTPHPGKGKAEITFNPGSCAQPDGGLQQLGGPGGGGGGGTDKTKPALGTMRFSASVFRAAGSGPAFGAQRRPIGTRVSFSLSEASAVSFTVQRKARGRKVGRKCAKPKRSNRRKKRCTRWESVRGSFTIAGKAGTNTFTFRGRIGGKKLRAGSYRLNGTATDPAKNKSVPKRKGFKIVR